MMLDKEPHHHHLPDNVIKLVQTAVSEQNGKRVLDHLSDMLFRDATLTRKVAACFHPLLQDLLLRGSGRWPAPNVFVTLSQLIGFHTVADRFSRTLYGQNVQKLPFSGSGEVNETISILKSCLTFLCFDSEFFTRAFDWSSIPTFIASSNPQIAWLASQCSYLLSGARTRHSDPQLAARFPDTDFHAIRMSFHHVFESRAIITTDCDLASSVISLLKEEDFCAGIVPICGVLLSKRTPSTSSHNSHIVMTESFLKSLHEVAHLIQSSTPVMIEGPVGCGKTSLIQHVAFLTNRNTSPHLTRVQLGDQIDSKLLIGGHFATEIPGEFVWRPGPLLSAMLNGHWILFEDIDSAPSDVVALLIAALRCRSLSSLPGSCISAETHCDFRIFFTRRTSGSQAPLQSELNRLTTVVSIVAPTDSELAFIIEKKWPQLVAIIPRIITTFRETSAEVSQSNSERKVSLRDLMKWCHRVGLFYKPSSPSAYSVFKDAADCFIPDPSKQMSKLQLLGVHLNVSKTEAEQLVLSDSAIPELKDGHLVVGRAKLALKPDAEVTKMSQNQSSFAFTYQSLRLLERIAVAVQMNEPVLLVGETGTGKTSTVQFLAQELGQKLVVANLNQQTDSCDLIGGYKPADLSVLFSQLVERFIRLFNVTFGDEMSVFTARLRRIFALKGYKQICEVVRMAKDSEKFSKAHVTPDLRLEWDEMISKAQMIEKWLHKSENKEAMLFSFIEGSLVKAMREGHWILLDEINLAEAEALQSLSQVLDVSEGPVILIDKADGLPVERHGNFRIFACMNPATDVGKKDLPLGIRNRFTEFHVPDLLDDRDLRILIQKYLPTCNKVEDIVRFYNSVREKSVNELTDSSGHRPHFSLRTLCRALRVASTNPCGDAIRSLYEAFCLSFLTQLDSSSKAVVSQLLVTHLIRGEQSLLKRNIPQTSLQHVPCEGYWLPRGSEVPVHDELYILTSTVRRNLKDLSRIISLGKSFPVLLQGETSVGKTSLIQFLAKMTGHTCHRVNNHEHTDLEEYVGSYSSDVSGKLVFKEGVLVEAMRKGHWIILDELNLAPTEVLEALNRVLDDNRELFIPETQTTVKAHPQFLLFATQNPAGLYGGRKILSRAFRNRFIELHFDAIPSTELVEILEKRCQIPNSYARKMVDVMCDLQRNRRSSEIFAGKYGFITLRDLFRWGKRYSCSSREISEKFFDWDLHLAQLGYMVLAARVRREEEDGIIRETLEKRLLKKKQTLDVDELFRRVSDEVLSNRVLPVDFTHVVATRPFRRLVTLVWSALKYKEPVLLIGETGCGKTTICQLFAAITGSDLKIVNCHMHSEGSDFLGNLRPVRNPSEDGRLFEWVDGPLVLALKQGSVFLMDEISLADDSVLERLNSILETERTLLLTEKGLDDSESDSLVIRAHDSFQFVATMNPAGDFGKKELSPALRNRFTEIWCPSEVTRDDLESIIKHNLQSHLQDYKTQISAVISSFFFYITDILISSRNSSLRDVLSWLDFVNRVTHPSCRSNMSLPEALLHGAQMVFIDALGCSGLTNVQDTSPLKMEYTEYITALISSSFPDQMDESASETNPQDSNCFKIGPFCEEIVSKSRSVPNFTFKSDKVRDNALKVLRGMQLDKPILLEGPPGVGKTSLLQAIAQHTGHTVIRINLSDQTDISDLFGTDLPAEGSDTKGCFEWRDGPLLQALKSKSSWIVLDELNLASQSVLEGLNACLDHRGEIFVAELGKTFTVNRRKTRIFACQNPFREGGERKGLPKSFLNRFTVVHIDSMTPDDMIEITCQLYENIEPSIVEQLVNFNQRVLSDIEKGLFSGPAWDFNLRDMFRCCDLLQSHSVIDTASLSEAISLVYLSRLRNESDRQRLKGIFCETFGSSHMQSFPDLIVTDDTILMNRTKLLRSTSSSCQPNLTILSSMIPFIHSVGQCCEKNWLTILVSSSYQQSCNIVRSLASLTGNILKTQSVNPQTDAVELLGGFEQLDINRRVHSVEEYALQLVADDVSVSFMIEKRSAVLQSMSSGSDKKSLLQRLENVKALLQCVNSDPQTLSEIDRLTQQVTSMESTNCSGRFEWVDSQLIQSMIRGHWLLLEDVNLCPASVLDRINSVFEPDGHLVLSEQGCVNGTVRTIKPHPNFRVFMTMDPAHGELSRAMRNRGVEVFVPTLKTGDQSIDVNAMIADPTVARVSQFPIALLTNNNGFDAALLKKTVHRIFIQRSSRNDLPLRLKRLSLPNNYGCESLVPIFEDQLPDLPIDLRLLSCHNLNEQHVTLINKWLFALYMQFYSRPIDPARTIGRNNRPLTDELYFVSRFYSLVEYDSAQPEGFAALRTHFVMLFNEQMGGGICNVDPKFLKMTKWCQMIQKLTSKLCLTSTETSSRAFTQVMKMFSQIPDRQVKVSVLHHIISFIDKLNRCEIPEAEIMNQSSRINNMTHLPCVQTEPAECHKVDEVVFLKQEKDALQQGKVCQFFKKRLESLIMTVDLNPLHLFCGQNSSWLTEHLLHHYRKSVEHRITNWDIRQSGKQVPNLLNFLSDSNSTVSDISSRSALTSVLRDHLRSSLFSPFKDQYSANAEIATNWLDKLEESGADSLINPAITFPQLRDMNHSKFNLQNTDILRDQLSCILFQSHSALMSCMALSPVVLTVDPVELKRLETSHWEMQFNIVSCELEVWTRLYKLERGALYEQYVNKHPHFSLLMSHQTQIKQRISELKKDIKFRPGTFKKLLSAVQSFTDAVLNPLFHHLKSVTESPEAMQVNMETVTRSAFSFAERLVNEFFLYWDLICPFVASLYLLTDALISLTEILMVRTTFAAQLPLISNYVESCCHFFQSDMLSTKKFIESSPSSFHSLITRRGSPDSYVELSISLLMDILNNCIHSSSSRHLIRSSIPIFQKLARRWRQDQERKKELEKKQAASVICQPVLGSDEESKNYDVDQLFPSHTGAFADIIPMPEVNSGQKELLPTSDLKQQVVNLFEAILFSKGTTDLLTPFMIKSEILHVISDCCPHVIETLGSEELATVQYVLAENATSRATSQPPAGFNIYKDCDETQALRCAVVLQAFKTEIDEILTLYLDHPTLARLSQIMSRMLSFDVRSPLIKFLTGAELLFAESQEWDKTFASREFKITTHCDAVRDLIIDWRKKELANWSSCLERVREKVIDDDMEKWWPILYEMMMEFDEKKVAETSEALKQFVETSSIAQFSSRLYLLHLFTIQEASLDKQRSSLLNLLHNMISFYRQFEPQVQSQLMTKPIEQETQNFVKVQQWKDLNYWSLKTSIEKSHRFLSQQMKKYRQLLMQPLAPHLIPNEVPNRQVKEKQKLIWNDFLVQHADIETDENILSDLSPDVKLLQKNVQRYSKRIMENCLLNINEQIYDEEVLISDITASVRGLQNLALDPSVTKPEERKKAIHHMKNRKRNELSNMFKFLKEQGISSSSGLQFFNSFDISTTFPSIDPVRIAGQETACDQMFFSCLVRLAQLKSSLAQPSKDLSPSDVDRIKGFAGDLTHMFVDNRRTFAKQTRLLRTCDDYMKLLTDGQNDVGLIDAETQAKLLVAKIDLVTRNSCSVESDEHVNLIDLRSFVQEINNSDTPTERKWSHDLTRLSFLLPADSILHKSVERIRTVCKDAEQRHEELHSQMKQIENSGVKQLVIHVMKSIENMLQTVESAEFQEDRLKDFISFDLLWKSLALDRFTSLLSGLCDGNSVLKISPLYRSVLDQYMQICRFLFSMTVEVHCVYGKLLQVLLRISEKLVREGFCLPPEKESTEESGETDEIAGVGMDAGQGSNDVSDRITSEDQLEDASQKKEEEKTDQKSQIKDEENAIEMSEDFDGLDQKADEKEEAKDDEESDNEEMDVDDRMGNDVNDSEEVLNKKLWENDEVDDDEIPTEESKEGSGDRTGEDQLAAKDDSQKKSREDSKQNPADQELDDVVNELSGDEDSCDGQDTNEKAAEEMNDQFADDLRLDDGNDADHSGKEEEDVTDEGEREKETSETESAKAEDAATPEEIDDENSADEEAVNDDEKEMAADEAPNSDALSSDRTVTAPSYGVESHQKDNLAEGSQQPDSNEKDYERNDLNEAGCGVVGSEAGTSQSQQMPGFNETVTQNRKKRNEKDQDHSVSNNASNKRRKILPFKQTSKPEDSDATVKDQTVQHVKDEDSCDGEAIDEAPAGDAMRCRSLIEEQTDENQDQETLMESSEEEEMEEELDLKKMFPELQKRSEEADRTEEKSEKESDSTVKKITEDKTQKLPRDQKSLFHTNPNLLRKSGSSFMMQALTERITDSRKDSKFTHEFASMLWDECSRSVASLVFELCQQLQLVLEPSKCSKLKGDYRTGKRINMRKVIAYIASQFRKDKIWLRRTKPSKRAYQIVLAFDDSRSMQDNESKVMAFQSLALLSRSLTLVEAGQISVIKFGEEVNLLHGLQDPFSDGVGPRLLTHFTFAQKQTRVAALLQTTADMLMKAKQSSSQNSDAVSQLLLIVSDGRGIWNEGRDRLVSMVRQMNDANIFFVFVILDNCSGQQSIFDITSVDFTGGIPIKKNYMDDFPFPFYIVLRDIKNMPVVLGEALRQWFELLTVH